jgi:ubiquinone/menaquinone biosynthesis C-methylase UbiE
MDEADNSDFYTKDSSTYEEARFSTAAGRDDHNRLMSCVADICASMDLDNIVEVGVGTGRVTRVLLEKGAKSIRCVDIAPGMLAVAAKKTASSRVKYIEGSAYALPISNNDCSAFVSVNLLTHLDDLHQFWREVGRVLRPGGFALVSSTKIDSIFFPFGFVANQRGSAYGQNVHTVWHRRRSQLEAISAAGGSLQSVTGHFYTPRALDRGRVGTLSSRLMRTLEALPDGTRARLAPMDIYLVRF